MSKAIAVRESDKVKDAYEIKLSTDMVQYLVDIDEGVKYANDLAVSAERIKVVDDKTNEKASEFIINMANAKKGLEQLRKIFSTPLYDRKKLIDDAFKRWLGNVDKQEDRLRRETGAYFIKKRDEAAEAQRKIDEENEKAAAKARATGRAIPKPIQPPVIEPEATTRTQAGTLNIRTKKVGKLVDINAVPRQFLMLNDKAVSAAINEGGVTAIPGVEIEEVPITTAR